MKTRVIDCYILQNDVETIKIPSSFIAENGKELNALGRKVLSYTLIARCYLKLASEIENGLKPLEAQIGLCRLIPVDLTKETVTLILNADVIVQEEEVKKGADNQKPN